MAWHIFRKDLILLWPLAALSALTQFGLDALMFVSDRTPDSQYLMLAARLSVLVVFLAITLTIAMGVHQEPIPGTRQDWLVRPIRRLDLLLAKLLFVLVAVQLPMLLGDLIEAMAHGFDWPAAGAAALSRNLLVLVTLSLPALGFAAMTRTTAQFIAVGVAYFIAITVATVLLSSVARIGGAEQATNPLSWTGVAWVPQTLGHMTLTVGAAIALLLLYLQRRIALARSVFPVLAVLSALMTLMPWPWIFAIQEAASAAPTASGAIDLAIDRQAPRYSPRPGENPDDYSVGAAQVQLRGRAVGDIAVENKTRRSQGDVTVFLPLRISGLPTGDLPWVDRATLTLKTAAGRLVYQGRGDDLKRDGGHAYQAVRIPALVYEAAKDEPLTLQIDYSMSVLRPGETVAAAPLGGEAQVPGFGRCATQRDSDGDDLEVRCLQAGPAPSCVSATLEDPSTGRRNPETRLCAPDYSPNASKLFPDSISRFEVEAPFRDRLGLANYPVGGAQLARARMLLTRYEASAHFTRRLVAADVRLAAWTSGVVGVR